MMGRMWSPLVVFALLLNPLAVAYVIDTGETSPHVPGGTAITTVRDFGAVGDGSADDVNLHHPTHAQSA